MRSGALPGAIPSPNLWRHPVEYEIENSAFDPDGTVDAALRALAPWAGARMLDVGCGTGFHLARLAAEAASVVGVEPHPRLAAAARRRTRSLPNVRVLDATAQCLPLADDTVDVAIARWAYFFGPGCEPGGVSWRSVGANDKQVPLKLNHSPSPTCHARYSITGHCAALARRGGRISRPCSLRGHL